MTSSFVGSVPLRVLDMINLFSLTFSFRRILAGRKYHRSRPRGHGPYSIVRIILLFRIHPFLIFFSYRRMSDLTDIEIAQVPLNPTLFPGVPSGIQVHQGFSDEHGQTASAIMSAVQSLLASTGAKSVTCVRVFFPSEIYSNSSSLTFFVSKGRSFSGWSLGSAGFPFLQIESAVEHRDQGRHLRHSSSWESCLRKLLQLPGSVFTFTSPSSDDLPAIFQVPDFVRINNGLDIVPILPGRFLGFEHPVGEMHIVSPGNAFVCPGMYHLLSGQLFQGVN